MGTLDPTSRGSPTNAAMKRRDFLKTKAESKHTIEFTV